METNKKLLVVLAVLLFAGITLASGLLPTANSPVEITKAEETAIKSWFGIADIDENFFVGELVCNTDTNSCKARISKKGLVNTDITISLTKCIDVNCTLFVEKTTQELTIARDAAIEARLKNIADVAAQRLARTETSKIGGGSVVVTTKP